MYSLIPAFYAAERRGIDPQRLNEFVRERITGTLQTALNAGEETSSKFANGATSVGVITTEEELEGFRIIKAILREVIDVGRIKPKDTKSYFGILLDGNTWKNICRLHFNSKQKYISFFDKEKKETKFPISSLEDIYGFALELKAVVNRLNKGNFTPEATGLEDEAVEEIIPSR